MMNRKEPQPMTAPKKEPITTTKKKRIINQIDDIIKNTCNWLGVTTEGMCEECEFFTESGDCSANDTGEAIEQIKELINKGGYNHD
jgi:hypothetical protein